MRRRWIVDASNVFGSRPDGWWRDRPRALRRLVDEIARWRAEAGEPVLVVADGHPTAWVTEGTQDGVHVVFAHSNAPDAADDEIVRIVAGHREPGSLTVVTSDRTLRSRVAGAGASTEGAGRFLSRIAGTAPRRSDREVLAPFGLDDGALLGAGGEARVYALGDDRVLRLVHGDADARAADERARMLEAIRAGAADVPFAVPEVLETAVVGGRAVVIERRLPGRNALELLADPATDREALVRSHLDAAAAIHRLPCPTGDFGEAWGSGAIRSGTFVGWATARLEASLVAGGAGDVVDPRALSAELADALGAGNENEAAPRLVHLDAFLGNMLASDHRITAVLDFGPTTIGGPTGLDPAVAVAYLAPEITPTANEFDRAVARAWAEDHGLADALEPAERWAAAYWTFATDDDRLQAWCRRVLRPT